MRVTWDIFCRVIDNFGDIGVTWRLAKQLNQEQGFAVRLWVDDLSAFHAICSAVVVTAEQQVVAGVEVCLWRDTAVAVLAGECADVVIEAFACQLPDDYIALMRARQKVLWLNLEYLTAEPWSAECHALPSMQGGGLHKYFFFPGFTENTGGLLREANLLAQRDAFIACERSQAEYLADLGVKQQSGERLISLFAYANPALPSLLKALSQDVRTNRLLVLPGPLRSAVAQCLAEENLQVGQEYQQGSLIVQVLPYIQQGHFDKLLWCCDLNFVRGEDSFVRAQWAGKPFVWHIYPQDDDAHLDKLEAFLVLYRYLLGDDAQYMLDKFWAAWNRGEDMTQVWSQFVAHEQMLQSHAACWSAQQNKQADLATKLALFYQDWL